MEEYTFKAKMSFHKGETVFGEGDKNYLYVARLYLPSTPDTAIKDINPLKKHKESMQEFDETMELWEVEVVIKKLK